MHSIQYKMHCNESISATNYQFSPILYLTDFKWKLRNIINGGDRELQMNSPPPIPNICSLFGKFLYFQGHTPQEFFLLCNLILLATHTQLLHLNRWSDLQC